jgi:DNA-binding transcriptional regulator YiaG
MAPVRAYATNLRLQEHRTRLDLTKEAVAEELARLAWVHYGMRVGVNADMVGKWERGEKRPSKLYGDSSACCTRPRRRNSAFVGRSAT